MREKHFQTSSVKQSSLDAGTRRGTRHQNVLSRVTMLSNFLGPHAAMWDCLNMTSLIMKSPCRQKLRKKTTFVPICVETAFDNIQLLFLIKIKYSSLEKHLWRAYIQLMECDVSLGVFLLRAKTWRECPGPHRCSLLCERCYWMGSILALYMAVYVEDLTGSPENTQSVNVFIRFSV